MFVYTHIHSSFWGYLVNTDENNKPYAMKSIPKRKKIKGLIGGKLTSELDDIMNEIAIMKKLVSSCFYQCFRITKIL
jgi:hypothetical protein